MFEMTLAPKYKSSKKLMRKMLKGYKHKNQNLLYDFLLQLIKEASLLKETNLIVIEKIIE